MQKKESLTGEGDGNVAKNVADVMVQVQEGWNLLRLVCSARKGRRRTIERKVGKGTLARPGKKSPQKRPTETDRQTSKTSKRQMPRRASVSTTSTDSQSLPPPNSATRPGLLLLDIDTEAVRGRAYRMPCDTALVPPPPVVRPAQTSDDIHVSRALQPTGDAVSPNALPVGRWLL